MAKRLMNFRLSEHSEKLLAHFVEHLGMNKTAVVERALDVMGSQRADEILKEWDELHRKPRRSNEIPG
jgi:hypothetical protein